MRIVIVDWNGENIGATFGSIFKLISRIWRHHCDNLLRPRLTWPTCNLCCFVIVVLYEWLWVKWRVSYKRQKLLTLYEHMVLPAGFFVVSLLFIFCCVFLFVFFCLRPVSCMVNVAGISILNHLQASELLSVCLLYDIFYPIVLNVKINNIYKWIN